MEPEPQVETFVLVKWPESQEYMEEEGVYLCNEPEKVGSSAYFVPTRIFYK